MEEPEGVVTGQKEQQQTGSQIQLRLKTAQRGFLILASVSLSVD